MSLQTNNENAFLAEFEINEGLIARSDRLIGFYLWIFRWREDIAARAIFVRNKILSLIYLLVWWNEANKLKFILTEIYVYTMHVLIEWIIFHNNILFIILKYIYTGRARHSNPIQILHVRFLCQDITEIGLLNPSHGKQLRPFRTIIKARRHILSEWYEIPRCNVALGACETLASRDDIYSYTYVRETECTFISSSPSVTITATRRPP